MMANQVWNDLKDKTEFWINGDIILEHSSNFQTKLLTLVLMEDTIKVRRFWNIQDSRNEIIFWKKVQVVSITRASKDWIKELHARIYLQNKLNKQLKLARNNYPE